MRAARGRHYSEDPLAGVGYLSVGWGRLLLLRGSVFLTTGHRPDLVIYNIAVGDLGLARGCPPSWHLGIATSTCTLRV